MREDAFPAKGISRRAFSISCAAGLGGLLARPVLAAAAPIATTTHGQVRGRCEYGVNVFRGIPYGASTAGRNRFAAPQPPQAWSGVRDAVDYGLRSPQLPDGPDGPGFSSWREPKASGEDCLALNVWTPGLADGKKRPVMVWLHGGGLAVGSGATPVTDGRNLAARQDVVVVAVNHRLNLFGYLYFGDLTRDRSVPANPGQLDMVAALQWVRDNIAAFGGDPQNVTIFGHSGGGLKVAGLMAMPAAKGLFHRAILQSGFGTTTVARDEAERITASLCKAVGVRAGDVEALRAIPIERLLAGLQEITGGNPVRGPGLVADGTVVARTPFAPDLPAVSPDIPVMVGHTSAETTVLFPPPGAFDLDWTSLPGALEGRVASPAPLIEGFRKLHPKATASDIFFAITTEAGMGRNARIVAETRAAGATKPAYAYLVNWQSPAQGGRMRSPHGIEVPMVFDMVTESYGSVGERMANAQHLADGMSRYWANFARTGDPNGDCLPLWPAYGQDQRMTMVFDTEYAASADPLGAEQALIARYA
ncbi:carboxylesterase/lipase family protein [Sphingobium sp. B11D3D]|uniref:carboxylesterase/lipase family protein n=1 Tax=Sphingobium sp. B11D3D TaxID=2940576 RepID=UPI002224D0B7|nr:carboxylesterase family protein [Sphingobium sp. B11D3D]MCW2370909.1 para-nitrobenzyl esterase [Sphingobium sp. B11D3D]